MTAGFDPGTRQLLLMNPNTDAAVTALMADIAQTALLGTAAGSPLTVLSHTARRGARLITHEAALDESARVLVEDLESIDRSRVAGVIIAAFGDPALRQVRALVDVPVTGLAEASMAEAASIARTASPAGNGRFAVVTTTPELVSSIEATAQRYGHQPWFAGVELTPGEPAALMSDAQALHHAMRQACQRAITERGATAIVIGGGPLARVAGALSQQLAVPVIAPIPAAVRRLVAHLR
jgi:Asp/Glu/hydantoin racemase